MENTKDIDHKLEVLLNLHTSALESWPDDGTERSAMRKKRLAVSHEVISKAVEFLKDCRELHPDDPLKVYVLFIDYLKYHRAQVLWSQVNYDDPMEVALFQGSLKGYDMIDERIYS